MNRWKCSSSSIRMSSVTVTPARADFSRDSGNVNERRTRLSQYVFVAHTHVARDVSGDRDANKNVVIFQQVDDRIYIEVARRDRTTQVIRYIVVCTSVRGPTRRGEREAKRGGCNARGMHRGRRSSTRRSWSRRPVVTRGRRGRAEWREEVEGEGPVVEKEGPVERSALKRGPRRTFERGLA